MCCIIMQWRLTQATAWKNSRWERSTRPPSTNNQESRQNFLHTKAKLNSLRGDLVVTRVRRRALLKLKMRMYHSPVMKGRQPTFTVALLLHMTHWEFRQESPHTKLPSSRPRDLLLLVLLRAHLNFQLRMYSTVVLWRKKGWHLL